MGLDFDGNIYGSDVDGANASIGANTQINPAFFWKKALLELVKERYFGQLADVKAMPKNMGKKIIRHHYLPLLHEENLNDQGIDSAGATIADSEWGVRVPQLLNNAPAVTEAAEASFTAAHLDGDYIFIVDSAQWLLLTDDTAIGYDASTTGGADGTELADSAIETAIELDTVGVVATVSGADIDLTVSQDLVYASQAAALDVVKIIAGSSSHQRSGNLYGSSKDVGFISGKMPALSEVGGRVNRVGFTRKTLEGSFEKFGFFDEYTEESMNFDTDAELEMHIVRETLRGANELTEDALQIDLLNAAGVIRYAGDATADGEVSAEGTIDEVDYDDLMRLGIDLDNNRCPKKMTMITGTRNVDTKTIDGARPLYIGSELLPVLRKMADSFGDRAYIPVHQYAAGGTVIPGEAGSIDQFRVVVVPEMMRWEGAGAAVGTNPGYRETNGRYDIYPMLSVGEGSFTTIGFQTDGKTVKFKIKHAKPGSTESYAGDPYGETGFYSIKWYYGFMPLRSEWISIVKTVAKL